MSEPDFVVSVDFEAVAVWVVATYPGCPGSEAEPPSPPEVVFETDRDLEPWQHHKVKREVEELWARRKED